MFGSPRPRALRQTALAAGRQEQDMMQTQLYLTIFKHATHIPLPVLLAVRCAAAWHPLGLDQDRRDIARARSHSF